MFTLPNLFKGFLEKIGFEIPIFKGNGLYGPITVTKKSGRVNLYTGKKYLQSSYHPSRRSRGLVWEWFAAAPLFSGSFKGILGSVLILGLGGGSIVKALNNAYAAGRVTGVELDPLIINLAKKYFYLNDANLTVTAGNAAQFVFSVKEEFDLVVVDAYRQNQIDSGVRQKSFLRRCRQILTPQGVLAINCVNLDDEKAENEKLIKLLKTIYRGVYGILVNYNLLLFATNSTDRPQSSEVLRVIKRAALENKKLSFFKNLKPSQLQILR